MSAALEYPQKHPISAEEHLRMGEAGVFAPEVRLELIEGETIEMAPIGSPHSGGVKKPNELFVQRASGRAIFSALVGQSVACAVLPEVAIDVAELFRA